MPDVRIILVDIPAAVIAAAWDRIVQVHDPEIAAGSAPVRAAPIGQNAPSAGYGRPSARVRVGMPEISEETDAPSGRGTSRDGRVGLRGRPAMSGWRRLTDSVAGAAGRFALPGRGEGVRARAEDLAVPFVPGHGDLESAATLGLSSGRGRRAAGRGTPARRWRRTRPVPGQTPHQQAEEADHDGFSRRAAQHGQAAVCGRTPALHPFDEHIVARCWGQNAPVRLGFERWLGSLDRVAGRLLGDDEISRRGHALMRRTGYRPRAGERDREMRDKIAAYQEPEDPQQVGHAAGAATVDVIFTLPAEVQASTVALCGEFNDWSAEDIWLERGSDGSWRATVALEPGRSYRYRYLLDGQRWENAWQADRYAPNSFGSTDSVIAVE